MKKILLILIFSLITVPIFAAEISDSDEGTYVSRGNNGEFSYQLSKQDGKWVWKDKEPGGPLARVNCLSQCDYRHATEAENQAMIPQQARLMLDLACLRNASFAFCRLTQKELPICGKTPVPIGGACTLESAPSPSRPPMYLMFVLLSDKPVLVPLSRVER